MGTRIVLKIELNLQIFKQTTLLRHMIISHFRPIKTWELVSFLGFRVTQLNEETYSESAQKVFIGHAACLFSALQIGDTPFLVISPLFPNRGHVTHFIDATAHFFSHS